MNERLFRDAMGKFATGVTVVLTEVNRVTHGATVNAFMSVSLNPMLVLISLKNDSQTLYHIKESKKFTVNILSSEQEHISNAFSSKQKSLDGVEFDSLYGLPIISGALSQIACTVSTSYCEGDHHLIIGKVHDIQVNNGDPLIFSEGKYRLLKELPVYR
ncbi:flavin reductase family protein [Bacillus andreraoultii]|uniref:flavin reductase family protein n=1 Tax=Bacillus andreraoultii TaxID=1499685 RepID=UPI00053B7486|nr:flavin reductase family protein [Bacillus andreraoultii]